MNLAVSPVNWTAPDIERWADQIGLPSLALVSLIENEIDGSVLVTLSQSDLIDELGIRNMAARRYLWDAILRLRDRHLVVDLKKAVEIHGEEIDALTNAAPEDHELDSGIAELLREDVRIRLEVIEDGIVARRMDELNPDIFRVYEDKEVAEEMKTGMDMLRAREEYDHAYAKTLAVGDEAREIRRQSRVNDNDGTVKSLMGLCIDSCVTNRINVAEALERGTVHHPAHGKVSAVVFRDTKRKSKKKMKSNKTEIPEKLPPVRCYACYGENLPGFVLACSHSSCQPCMTRLLQTCLGDNSLLPLKCCEIPIDMNVSRMCLPENDCQTLLLRLDEMEAKNKMYCPNCNRFLNLDLIDSSESTDLNCECGTRVCVACKSAAHGGVPCHQNRSNAAAGDAAVLRLAKENKWKQCPGCSILVELARGCNHMTCANCNTEFCYQCLSPWNGRTGSCESGTCLVWEEENLLEGGEARVQVRERQLGRAFQPAERQHVLQQAMRALDANETCDHNWSRRNLRGQCERCDYTLWSYGMVCQGACRSTVCYTCAHHRIPHRGWR